jgi:hypothetical protein
MKRLWMSTFLVRMGRYQEQPLEVLVTFHSLIRIDQLFSRDFAEAYYVEIAVCSQVEHFHLEQYLLISARSAKVEYII